VLVAQGKLPRPERIVMADTSRETITTFEYLDNHIAPLLATVDCKVEIVPHSYARQGLYYKYADDRADSTLPSMPVWTRQDGKISQLQNHCSGVWKRDSVKKWLREPEQGYGRKKPIVQWMGFSRDEISRCKPSGRKWIENQWPLIMGYGLSFNRRECVQLVLDAGLPEPPKSRCYMCPYQSPDEWREIKSRPDEWAKAIELDIDIRDKDEQNAVFLHRSGVPLEEADLLSKPMPLLDYAEMECADGCWV